jgi:hypothetical protein
MSVKIISGYTDNIKELADISFSSYINYCLLNGVRLERYKIEKTERPPSWYKIEFILDNFADGIDWVMWVDADTFLVNEKYSLYDLIENKGEGSEIIISKDINDFNCGVMLWKNTDKNCEILKAMWNEVDFIHHIWWEQASFINLYNNNYLGMQETTKIVPQKEINAFHYSLYGSTHEEGQLNEDSFIFHLPGMEYHNKLSVIKSFYESRN